MPSTDSSRAGALMPISLSMAGDTVDMSVPSNIALAELVPVLVKAVSPLDPGTATRGFTIRTSDGNVLSQSKTLPEQKVRPGAVLTLEPMGSNSQDQRYDDLVEAGSMAAAKAAGKVRMEGKDYVMEDGDVVEFRTGLTSGGKK